MFKKSLSLTLALFTVVVWVRPALASSQEGEEARRVAKVKADVAKRGVGEKAKIKVKLQNKTELKGYVYQAGEDSFVVADAKAGTKTTVPYHDVTQVKGKGLSTAAKIGIGVGIGVGVIIVVIAVAANSIDSAFGR